MGKKIDKENNTSEISNNNEEVKEQLIDSHQFCVLKGLKPMYNFLFEKKFGKESLKTLSDWEEIFNKLN